MKKAEIIIKAKEFVKKQHQNDYSGHDWWHIIRVTNIAKAISIREGGNEFIVELAALMHDVADEKVSGSEEAGLRKVNKWLKENDVEEQIISEVIEIITTMSFKGGNLGNMKTMEGRIVQDADRLDALGAIGIARTFAYSGAKDQPIYDPDLTVRDHLTYEEYRRGKSTAINHFYEKLLKLKDAMNTEYGKKLAEERHEYMIQFLDQFFLEWGHDEKSI